MPFAIGVDDLIPLLEGCGLGYFQRNFVEISDSTVEDAPYVPKEDIPYDALSTVLVEQYIFCCLFIWISAVRSSHCPV
jgi:hypothetical protein